MNTYTDLRDFLDRYTNDLGEIQGDPATIAAEAAGAGIVQKDENFYRQHEDDESRAKMDEVTTLVGNAITALDDPAGIPGVGDETTVEERIAYAKANLSEALRILELDTYEDRIS